MFLQKDQDANRAFTSCISVNKAINGSLERVFWDEKTGI